MKIEGRTIIFKSVPRMYAKELGPGIKNNTVRSLNKEEIIQVNKLIRSAGPTGRIDIKIVNSESGESFCRELIDFSFIKLGFLTTKDGVKIYYSGVFTWIEEGE